MTASAIAEAAAGILARLVAFDTVSERGNRNIIDWIAAYLADFGINAEIVAAPGHAGHDRFKANLWATIGPKRDGGIVLSGHTDVVPVADQPWSSDPFALRDGGDRFYGRGTCDMKGFIALVLAAIPHMLAAKISIPLHLAFSYDEEVGCQGAPHMIAEIGRRFAKPRIAIIGEPTEMRLGLRHKGVFSFTTTTIGTAGHSSQPERGANAIQLMNAIVGEILRLYEALKRQGPFDAAFDPPHCSLNLGRIEGGTAANIIARECRLIWDFRPVPGAGPDLILEPLGKFADRLSAEWRKTFPEVAIATEPRVAVPPLREEHEGAAEALLKRLTGANETVSLAFATEAGQFQAAGLSAIVCGPGSIRQAHQPDEYILKSQLALGADFLARLIGWAKTG